MKNKILIIPDSQRDVCLIKIIQDNKKINWDVIIFVIDNSYSKEIKTELDYQNIDYYENDIYCLNSYYILEQNKIDLTIIFSDMSAIGRSFLLSSKKLHIPVLLVIQGKISKSNINHKNLTANFIRNLRFHLKNYQILFFSKFSYPTIISPYFEFFMDFISYMLKYDLRGTYNPNLILTITKREKLFLMKKGVDENKIVCYFTDPCFTPIKYFNGDLQIVIGTSAAVEHGSWSEFDRDRIVTEIINAIHKTEISKIIICPHPKENIQVYKKLKSDLLKKQFTNNNGSKIIIKEPGSFKDQLSNKTIYISTSSTSLYYTSDLGIPSIDYKPYWLYNKLSSHEVTNNICNKKIINIDNFDQLVEVLVHIISNMNTFIDKISSTNSQYQSKLLISKSMIINSIENLLE
jgi:hypothetical protein